MAIQEKLFISPSSKFCLKDATDCLNAFSSIWPELPIDSNKGLESVNIFVSILMFIIADNCLTKHKLSSTSLSKDLVSTAFGDIHTFLMTPDFQYRGEAATIFYSL